MDITGFGHGHGVQQFGGTIFGFEAPALRGGPEDATCIRVDVLCPTQCITIDTTAKMVPLFSMDREDKESEIPAWVKDKSGGAEALDL